jgi:DNA-binding CsgD family transcriptional regulator
MTVTLSEKPKIPGAALDDSSKRLVPFKPDARHRGIGFLLTDVRFKPIYLNESALSILTYPQSDGAQPVAAIQERLRSILQVQRYTAASLPPVSFFSGRRRYVCRSFLLESQGIPARQPTVGVLLERHLGEQVALFEVSRRFHLSPRERETVQHLIHGLTTKEIAQRMNVSPNTVKQFVRLILSKMRVTTRSGIVGKILSG